MKYVLGTFVLVMLMVFVFCAYAVIMSVGNAWAAGIVGVIALFVAVCCWEDVVKVAKGIV